MTVIFTLDCEANISDLGVKFLSKHIELFQFPKNNLQQNFAARWFGGSFPFSLSDDCQSLGGCSISQNCRCFFKDTRAMKMC